VSTAGGAADPLPPLEITREPFESMVAQALVDALMVDLDERYAADGAGDGDNPDMVAHFILRAEQVAPPAGVFLVVRLDGGLPPHPVVRPVRGRRAVGVLREGARAPCAAPPAVPRVIALERSL